jgi:hypothetical protein
VDCASLIRSSDGEEFFSTADGHDLGTDQILELEFAGDVEPGEVGLLIRGRASLLSTFLFYQTLAYVGDEAGRWLAEVERGDEALARQVMGLPNALGPIQVFIEGDGAWREAGRFGEAGPIASDEQVLPLGHHPGGPLRIKLKMTQGAWRLDRVGLVRLGPEVKPTVIQPTRVGPVTGDTPGPVALERLLDPDAHLVTQQGEAYALHFRLPADGSDLALFLDSRGYYYEWMRKEWEGEEDPAMAALILAHPQEALKRLAPAFKAREGTMEEIFWSSRFRRNER